MREILFVAGEHSGDLHASSVARELVALGAQFRLRGVGGGVASASPPAACGVPSRRTIRTTSPRAAPSAMRIPISGAR